jgi:hypothetical protein
MNICIVGHLGTRAFGNQSLKERQTDWTITAVVSVCTISNLERLSFLLYMISGIPNKNQLHLELNVDDISQSFIIHMLQHWCWQERVGPGYPPPRDSLQNQNHNNKKYNIPNAPEYVCGTIIEVQKTTGMHKKYL